MLYELENALKREFPTWMAWDIVEVVEDFSSSTEGFQLDEDSRTTLRLLGQVDFYGFGRTSPLSFQGAWGGTFGAARSRPDLAANRAGWKFWQQFLSKPWEFRFDICNFINKEWLEPAP